MGKACQRGVLREMPLCSDVVKVSSESRLCRQSWGERRGPTVREQEMKLCCHLQSRHLSVSPVKAGGRDFPGGPVVMTLLSKAGGVGSIPGQGPKIPHASQPKKPKHKTEAML